MLCAVYGGDLRRKSWVVILLITTKYFPAFLYLFFGKKLKDLYIKLTWRYVFCFLI